jgi:hypothetical protein
MLDRLFINPLNAVNVIPESSDDLNETPEPAVAGRPVYVHETPVTGVSAASEIVKDAWPPRALTNNTISITSSRNVSYRRVHASH